jgi:hypothetical protein
VFVVQSIIDPQIDLIPSTNEIEMVVTGREDRGEKMPLTYISKKTNSFSWGGFEFEPVKNSNHFFN